VIANLENALTTQGAVWALTSPHTLFAAPLVINSTGTSSYREYATVAIQQSPPGSADSDGDGVVDLIDNCTNVANPTQRDADGDGCGNRCDGDFNQSGITAIADYGVFKACFGRAAGVPGGPFDDPTCSESDMNGSGAVNIADFGDLRLEFGTPPGPSGDPFRAGLFACP
jgi:hypothetical protein